MTDYLKAVNELEIEIEVNLSEYYNTGDFRYVEQANHWSSRLEDLRRFHYEGDI